MMKVLILISTPEMGGAQRVAFNMAHWLQKHPLYESYIVSLGAAIKNSYDTTGYNYIQLPPKGAIFKLREIIKKNNIDILITMGVPLDMCSVLANIGTKTKHIISERNDPSHFAGKWITKVISRQLMKFADGFVFQTRDAQEYYGGNIAKKSLVIPNPLIEMSNIPDKQYNGVREKTIVSVGRLIPQKNHCMLIRAFGDIHNIFPDYRLIIYGEGQCRKELETLINKYGLQKFVNLPGTTSDLLDKIYKASLFVMTSDFEGMPNALMEAMALGLPCISTDCPCGGPRDLINNGVNGVLIPVNDECCLKKEMIDLLRNNNRSERMGSEAFKIRESHNIDAICLRWAEYFKELIKQ